MSAEEEQLDYTLEAERIIEATAEDVWKVLADFQAVGEWAARIDHVEPLGEIAQGLGAGRRCTVRGLGVVDEVVDLYDPPRAFGYRVGGSGPLAGAQSRWMLAATGEGATRVRLQLSYTPRFGLLGRVLNALVYRHVLARNLPGALALLRRHVLNANWTLLPTSESEQPGDVRIG